MNRYQIATIAVIAGFILLSSFQIEKPYGSCPKSIDDCAEGSEEYLSTMSALGTIFPTQTKFPTSTDEPTPTKFVNTLIAPSELPLLKSSSPLVKQTYRQMISDKVGFYYWYWLNNDIVYLRFQDISYIDLKKGSISSTRNLYAPGVPQEFIDTLAADGYGKVKIIFRSPSGNRMLIYRKSQFEIKDHDVFLHMDIWVWEKGKGFSVLSKGSINEIPREIIPETAAWSKDENIFYVSYIYLNHYYELVDTLTYFNDRRQRGIFVKNLEDMPLLDNLGDIWPKNFVISGDSNLAAFDMFDKNKRTSDIVIIKMDELDTYFYQNNSIPPLVDTIRRLTYLKLDPPSEWSSSISSFKPITWGPDSKSIFFADKTDDDSWAIVKYDLKTKRRSIWMKYSDFETQQGKLIHRITPPDFSPDGKRFILDIDNTTLIYEESKE